MLTGLYRSAADLAWDIVLSGSEDSTLLTYMDPRNFALKGRGFSRAHLLVLGLTTQDSRDIYEIEPSLVDIADVDGRTPLYWAIRRKDIVAAQLLLQHGANPNAGVSALPWACKDRYQSVDVLAAILQYGADPDATDEDGYIALQACGIYGRSRDFTKTLVSHGASIDAPYEGRYSLYNGITPLGFSAFYTHLGTLGDLLYDGANVNHQDHQGRTPLHLAVQSHERSEITVKCVRRLLDAGVDTTIRDHKGYTATNLAMSVQDIECLQLLLAAGVDPSPPFSDPSERSNAFLVLKWALENGWKESATFFLSKVSLYDLDPRTGDDVLQIVARFGNRRVLETLESAFFALPYLDEFSTDVNDYEINTELRQDSQFEGLLSRMKDRIEEDSRASRESEEHHVDEAISIFADLDDEPLSVNEKLHENAKPAGNFDRGDLDSGYATDSSDYFHRSEGNQTAQNIDMGKLRLRLGRDSTDDLKSIENKPRKEPTMIGYKVIYSIVMLGILLLEFWRTATNLSSSIRKALNVWLRRRPKPGHTRISWTCVSVIPQNNPFH